jgi:hypothetical protein
LTVLNEGRKCVCSISFLQSFLLEFLGARLFKLSIENKNRCLFLVRKPFCLDEKGKRFI